MSDITDRLWKRFERLDIDDLPSVVIQIAQHCILDWFGCAVAGSREPLAGILRDELGVQDGPATIVGTAVSTGMLQAALINGATGHALDFDDTHIVMGGHPTAPLLPAVLALAEDQGRTGADLLVAFVVGLEVESQLGTAIGGEHYAKGWHQTSTMGVFGAAAGCSWLLDLDSQRFGHAMGIAASNSAGLKANFGTMTKPFHAGHAAERGLLAARLAARGFTANSDAIHGNQGLAQAAGSGGLRFEKFDEHADAWLTDRTLFKYHAACYLTHAGIEATKAAVPDLTDINGIVITVNPTILDVCGIANPTTGLEAKFSLRGTQALLVNGADTGAVATYEDGPINEPAVQEFIERVTVETDESLHTTATRVVVSTPAGSYEGFADTGVPSTDLDGQGLKLRAKFNALVDPVLGPDVTSALADTISNLSDLNDVRALLE